MNHDRMLAIQDEIMEYDLKLEADPVSLGPKYLTETIATCRNYLNNVARLMLEIRAERQRTQKELLGAETVYSIEANELITSDMRVRALPNIKDRESQIQVILKDQYQRLSALRVDLKMLATLEQSVKFRHSELRDTMSEIKLQRNLLRDDLDTGAFYGDERVNGHPTKRREHDYTSDEIARLLDDGSVDEDARAGAVGAAIQAPIHPKPQPSAPSPKMPQADTDGKGSEDEAIQSFLGPVSSEGGVDVGSSASEEEDELQALLGSI